MDGKILVIGATGVVGSDLTRRLVGLGESVRAATRHPMESARRFSVEAEFVELDLERPETFAPALHGVDRVFLMARPGDEEADRVAAPLIGEMKRQGVRHVVHLSAMGARMRDDFSLRRVERCLEESGIPFTHLRPNWFMQIFIGGQLFSDMRATGTFRLPAADARISFIDARDIAAVAALTLTAPGHENNAYTLTGNEALHHHEIARLISETVGKEIGYVPLTDEDAGKMLKAAGMPEARIDRLITFYQLVRAGWCAPVTSEVATLLGRPPISFAQFVDDHAGCWSAMKAVIR